MACCSTSSFQSHLAFQQLHGVNCTRLQPLLPMSFSSEAPLRLSRNVKLNRSRSRSIFEIRASSSGSSKDSSSGTNLVLFSSAVTITFAIANRVLYKLALVPMKDYPFFLAQFTTFGYVVIYFSILYSRYRLGIVTNEMLAIPKLRFVAIGFLEALGVATGMSAGAILPGPVIPILNQTFLVWQLMFSTLLLGRRYSVNQFSGCLLVGAGVVVAFASGSNTGQMLSEVEFFWPALMIVSSAFQAGASVIKESVSIDSAIRLKHKSLDIFVVNSFGSGFQIAYANCYNFGEFSTKTAYKAISNEVTVNSQNVWKTIWTWQGPERIKYFLGRALKNGLLTNVRRARMNMIDSNPCPVCLVKPETTLHILRDCTWAIQVWSRIVHSSGQSVFYNQNDPVHVWLQRSLSCNMGISDSASGFLQFGIECDNFNAVELVYKGCGATHPLALIVRRIQSKMKALSRVHITHVFREANRVADFMANLTHSCSLGLHVFNTPPMGCSSLLVDDSSGISFSMTILVS